MRIRKFKEEDASIISDIMKRCNAFTKEHLPPTAKALCKDSTPERLIEKSKTRTYYVAELENKVVGICGYYNNEVKTFFVDPYHHRKGIGRKLIKKVLDSIEQKDYKEIVVNSSLFAVPIYEKFGFKKGRKITVKIHGAPLIFVRMRKNIVR